MKLYHRVIISGILYTSSAYTRSKIKNDSVLCFKKEGQKHFGRAKSYVSFCTNECLGCTEPCKHMVIVTAYGILPVNIGTDEITGATAQHVHCVQPLRYVLCNFNLSITSFNIMLQGIKGIFYIRDMQQVYLYAV